MLALRICRRSPVSAAPSRVGALLTASLRRGNSTVAETADKKTPEAPVHIYEGVNQAAYLETQAPNRKATWAPSQQPREEAMTGPRFDGKDLATQPQPYAAIELIHQQPIQYVHGTAVCDGNYDTLRGGVQGHPKIFISVEKPGVHACTYCGNRYADEHFRGAIESGEFQ